MLSYKDVDTRCWMPMDTRCWTGSYSSSIPSGCSIRINEGISSFYPHFEESATGLGTGRSDLTPVCKKSPAFGNFYNSYKRENMKFKI